MDMNIDLDNRELIVENIRNVFINAIEEKKTSNEIKNELNLDNVEVAIFEKGNELVSLIYLSDLSQETLEKMKNNPVPAGNYYILDMITIIKAFAKNDIETPLVVNGISDLADIIIMQNSK